MNQLMECGCVASGKDSTGAPICVSCIGIIAGAETIVQAVPDLTGRISKCLDCKRTTESSFKLAFFQLRPDSEFDIHYDGCRGWD